MEPDSTQNIPPGGPYTVRIFMTLESKQELALIINYEVDGRIK